MAEKSQYEIDRQTIAAFEKIWQDTVILGTSDSVKKAVNTAIADLVQKTQATSELNEQYRNEIAQHASNLVALGQQVDNVITSGKTTIDHVKKVAEQGPELAEKLTELQAQVTDLTTLLESNQGWRKRLAHWQEDRDLREVLGAIAKIARNPAAEIQADDEAAAEEADSGANAAIDGDTAENATNTQPLSVWGGYANLWKNYWHHFTVIAVIFALAGWGAASFIPNKEPKLKRDENLSLVAFPQDENAKELVDAEWNYLRGAGDSKADLAAFCDNSSSCPADLAGNEASLSDVWAAQSPERQRQLFEAIIKAAKSKPLAGSQCQNLIAEPNLANNALEFMPYIAACTVEQSFRRENGPIDQNELYAIVARLLEFRQVSFLSDGGDDSTRTSTSSSRTTSE